MKKFFVIIIAAMTMSANAMAQNVNSEISTNDFGACKDYLTSNPGDTIREAKDRVLELIAAVDTTFTRNEGKTTIVMQKGDKLFFAGIDVWQENNVILRGNHYVVERINPLPAREVADEAEVRAIDEAAAATQAAELIASNYNKRERDRYFYQADKFKLTDGKVIDHACDKYGWSLNGEVGYRAGKDIGGLTAALGLRYTMPIGGNWALGATVQARIANTKFAENAVQANENYLTGGGRVGAEIGYALNAYKTVHVYVDGGFGMDFQNTETKMNNNGLLQSKNSEPYPFVGVKLTFEKFAKRFGGFVRVGWEQEKITVQNLGTQKIDCVMGTVGFNIPFLRHWVKTK
jgi:hypothetical protein